MSGTQRCSKNISSLLVRKKRSFKIKQRVLSVLQSYQKSIKLTPCQLGI